MCHNQEVNVNKPAFIQIRIFTAKENEDLKQVACINYTLNEFKHMSQILGCFRFVNNCKFE